MTQSVSGLGGTADFCLTFGAAEHLIVGTGNGTARINHILLDSIAGGMRSSIVSTTDLTDMVAVIIGIGMILTNPLASGAGTGVGIGVAGNGLIIGTVAVEQSSGLHGNVHLGDVGAALGSLRNGGVAGLGDLDDTTVHAHNGSTACTGAQLTSGGIQGTCHGDLDVTHLANGTGVLSIGNEAQSRHIHCGVDKALALPVVQVIDIQRFATGQLHLRTLVNIEFTARLQGHIGAHGDGAAVNVNRHGAGNRQNIIYGLNVVSHQTTQTTDLQRKAVNGDIAIHIDMQTVGGLDIVLCDAAGGQIEQTAGGANETNIGGLHHVIGDIQSGKGFFRGTSIQGHGNHHILNVVLAHGEGIALAEHTGGSTTTTEVCQLEALIYRTATLDGHGTLAGDVAIDTELCTAVDGDGAAGLHVHMTILATGSTARLSRRSCTGIHHRRNGHGAIDNDIRILRHGHGEVGGGIGTAGYHRARLVHIAGVLAIKGDQQGHIGRDGIGTCRQNTVIDQHDGILGAANLFQSHIQTLHHFTGGLDAEIGGNIVGKHRHHGGGMIVGEVQLIGIVIGDHIAIGICPIVEVTAFFGGSNQIGTLVVGGEGRAAGDSRGAVLHGTQTAFIGHRHIHIILDGGNGEIAQSQLCGRSKHAIFCRNSDGGGSTCRQNGTTMGTSAILRLGKSTQGISSDITPTDVKGDCGFGTGVVLHRKASRFGSTSCDTSTFGVGLQDNLIATDGDRGSLACVATAAGIFEIDTGDGTLGSGLSLEGEHGEHHHQGHNRQQQVLTFVKHFYFSLLRKLTGE